jgi:DNA helicase-2/ATP-dependent DNA helicase PcrA
VANLYEKKLKETEYIDFIDIINIAAKIINEQKYVRQSLQSKFPWLLIDEYQDLGKALHEMVLELIINTSMKLYVVGDINQSIYGFNGGYPDFLQELTTYGDVKTVFLDSNYRSSQPIIDASLEALQPTPPLPNYTAEKRKDDLADFTFITCEEEMGEQYDIVSKKVIPNLLKKEIPFNEIGIITNSNVQIKEMAYYLKKDNIPFFIVNWSFENSAVMLWLQECAIWCTNRNKQSFEDLFKFWIRLINNHNDFRKGWESIRLKTFFYDTLHNSLISKDLLEWVNFLVSHLGLCETLVNSEEYPNEVNNIRKLQDEVKLYNLKNANIQRFANLGFPENEVTITTRHSSKGLEFEAIILLGMEEEHFPNYYHLGNKIALAEDQRLCYVCISRAKKVCILIRSKIFTFRKWPWRKTYAPSRYWISLYNKFGSDKNSFSNKTYT